MAKQLVIVSDGKSTKEVLADPLRRPIFENITQAAGNVLVTMGTRAFNLITAEGFTPTAHNPTTRAAAKKQTDVSSVEMVYTSKGQHSGLVELVGLLEAKHGAFDQIICMGFDGAKIVKHADNATLGDRLIWSHNPTKKNTGPVAKPGRITGHGTNVPGA